MSNILVSDIMTRDPVVIKPNASLLDCATVMVKKKLGSLLLVDNKKLVGIISRKDILWALVKKSKQDLSKIKAIDISPRKIATVKPSSTVKEALSKMNKFKFQTLPVINEGGLVGLVTVRDILNFHPELYPELEEFTSIREESEKIKRFKKAKTEQREGYCEECGNFDLLYMVHGNLICESCRDKI